MKKQATKIKICGLTKEKEADYLNQIHADFAGMVVFFPKSKRNISLDQAKKIKSALLPEIKTVAVTVSPTLAQISQIAEAGFDLIQIHGDPADLDIKTAKSICEYTSKFSLPILKAFNVSDIDSYNYWQSCPSVAGFVFDAAKPGSGKTFDGTPQNISAAWRNALRSNRIPAQLRRSYMSTARILFSPTVCSRPCFPSARHCLSSWRSALRRNIPGSVKRLALTLTAA